MKNSHIGWTHNTQNFWLGCDKIAPECAHCYIARQLLRMGLEEWGSLYRAKTTWGDPLKWQREAVAQRHCLRIFTNSLSDFFHADADLWREEAWDVIRSTPNAVYLILTKRPELISKRLPKDWGDGWANDWLGVSCGCKMTLNKMDALRRIPIHPRAVRFLSAEPLLEDISEEIDLNGFGWLIAGGESGGGREYLWDSQQDWRQEFGTRGRRTMQLAWARKLLIKSRAVKLPFFFKQITAARSGVGEDALGWVYQDFPPPPFGVWKEADGEKS